MRSHCRYASGPTAMSGVPSAATLLASPATAAGASWVEDASEAPGPLRWPPDGSLGAQAPRAAAEQTRAALHRAMAWMVAQASARGVGLTEGRVRHASRCL